MKYGYFDNQNREYVITDPQTPTPWMNYIGNGGFGGIVSNTGGGLSFDGDPSNRRVTRYKFNNQPIDRPGRYLYIRDEDSGDYWSATWQPVMKSEQKYQCRHGLGYTVITGTYSNIHSSVTYCVPLGKRFELWNVTLTNQSDHPRTLRLYSYVEFSFHDAKWDMLAHWPCMALRCDFQENKIIVDTCAEQLAGTPLYDYIATDLPIIGYDCDPEHFVGLYRSESNPQVLDTGVCTNSNVWSNNCIGVLCSQLTLAAGETRSLRYTLGATDRQDQIDFQIQDAFSLKHPIDQIRQHWLDYTAKFRICTPCDDMNTMLNTWNAYQAKTTFDWSRFISFYERGVDRGFGFRDSMQDVLGVMHAAPEAAKERIKLLLSIQCQNGNARSIYYPAVDRSEGGGRSDDHLWSIFSVCTYIKETGDYGFADEIVPYADGGNASVIDHLDTGIQFTMNHLGKHGIPLMLKSDWDDGLAPMNKGGTLDGESVFVFFQLGQAAYELVALYDAMGLQERSSKMLQIFEYCKSKMDVVWDGSWYLRAFTPSGDKYCTQEDEFNQIHMIPQAWSVLSHLADKNHANMAMDQVKKYLYTDLGFKTHFNPSEGFDPSRKAYYLHPAGSRENGGIFFHANTWVIMAFAMLGRSEDAFRSYCNMLSIRRNDMAEICRTEPYVYSQTMNAPPHQAPWKCVNSWLTGTASWSYFVATQYILGIRPEYKGLLIDPQIPLEWDSFSACRICRGTEYHIHVYRSEVKKGLYVNGIPMESNYIPWSIPEKSIIATLYI